MSPFDSQKPPAPAETPGDTEGPRPSRKFAITRRERDAIVARVCTDHGEFLERLLRRRARIQGISPASTEDLQQAVLLAVTARVEKRGPITHERGFLRGAVKNTVRNHKKKWRPPIQEGADLTEMASREQDPEGAAELAEKRRKLERDLVVLSVPEAQVIRCMWFAGLGTEETATFLERPESTVATQYATAVKKLKQRADESERGTILRKQRGR